MIVASMSACAGLFGLGGDSWKEEVLLHDGSKIIVKRSQGFGGSHEIGQTPPIKEQAITFAVPNTNKSITFESEYGQDIGRANFKLLALHILNDTPYVITRPNLCLSYNKWGRPNPPYVVFKHDGKEWQRITLKELPLELKEINLLINTKGEREIIKAQSIVTAEIVKRLNGELTQPEYKTILREPMVKVEEECGEMIYDGKSKWIGTGWFSEKPSYGACLDECKYRKIDTQYCPCETLFKEKK
jgi:hypothetical protein